MSPPKRWNINVIVIKYFLNFENVQNNGPVEIISEILLYDNDNILFDHKVFVMDIAVVVMEAQ